MRRLGNYLFVHFGIALEMKNLINIVNYPIINTINIATLGVYAHKYYTFSLMQDNNDL